jgi:hypothetical protein
MTFQYFSGHVRGLRGPGLTEQQAADVDAAIEGAVPIRPRAVSAIYQETIPADVTRISAQSYYPLGTPGVSPRDRGGSDLVEVSSGPATVYRTQDATGRWWEIVRSAIMRLSQFGIKGGDTFGTAPDETDLINGVLSAFPSYGQVFYLDRVYRVSSYAAFKNPKGCRFIGPGDIVFPVAADPNGPSQYAGHISAIFDDDDKLESCGEEYLVAIRNRFRAKQTVRMAFFGDSRYAGDTPYNGVLFDQNNFAATILPRIALDLGLPAELRVTNFAVAGTTLEDAANGNTAKKADGSAADGNYPNLSNGLTPGVAAASGSYDWVGLAFGINEFKLVDNDADRPGVIDDIIEEVIDFYDGQFAAYRARPVKDLAITFFGPTSANHVRFQTADAIKRLIPALRRLCRLHQIHYVDLYSRWSDTARMAHVTVDGAFYPNDWPYVPSRGKASSGPLHNLDVQQAALWGMIRDHMRRWFVTADATNRLLNPPLAMQTKAVGDLPSTYPLGQCTFEVLAANGWEADGWLVTVRTGSGLYAEQTYRRGDTGVRKLRAKISGEDAWGAWA